MTETDPNGGRVRRVVTTWLGILILSFNILGGGVAASQAGGASSPLFAQELLGDRIVVCTAAGMVVMDLDGNVIDTNGSNAHSDFCVYCLPMLHGGFQAPSAAAEYVDFKETDRQADYQIQPHPIAKLGRLVGASSPRAPPLV